ncbi:MAG: hypothetical protein A2X50_00915 [Candidatus Rokubacteria bacterium GWF2_70_14]|nr:MAG: hypothetical protein A2X53_13755 [Candidatus Rokubacteria bacterium GWA2_70_23]OGK88730.1 MAG: hypothetical protein A2X50_00915 [Candidatus Rokubacteria bacterium GWF2_70_14]
MSRWKMVLAGALAGALAVGAWMLWRPALPPPGGLEVSGRIEGDQAAIGVRVGGKIVKLAVREGDRVAAGQPIAELSSEQAGAQLEQAEHALHTAREQLGEARAGVISAQRQAESAEAAVTLAERESAARAEEAAAGLGATRAQLKQAEADQDKASRDHGRSRELFARELIASQQLDEARAADAVAGARVAAAREHVAQAQAALDRARASRIAVEVRRSEARAAVGRVSEARAAVATAEARIQTAAAGVKLARANLGDARVTAPFSGTVLTRMVEAGEVVAAGTPLVTLVDLSRLHAKVYVAERDLGKLKLGDAARVYTDAFPGRYFGGAVVEISQQAEFTPRDVHMKDERATLVFAVKLALENPAGVLKPGMAVDGWIRWMAGAPWADGRAD